MITYFFSKFTCLFFIKRYNVFLHFAFT